MPLRINVKDMSKQHKLSYFGGGGAFLYNVKNINISFASREMMDLGQARKLLISCSEELLRRINANDRIRPYLEHFPFSEKGISLGTSYFDSKLNRVQPKYIARVCIIHGNIYYTIYDKEADTLKTIHEETYQEALNIVRSQNNTQESSDILNAPRSTLEEPT
ncbi:hypothetical protein COB11_07875 [Candidatus Aerophobetes bacterium]|uniref:Uncharacterized protein n=1 Tax=Aerophobetes bacterium TaxID=2030807 RepID=A0A2A4YBY0_UNCAE|nr:MAG: hypothetical protein COB11_07875 [Candidatus Aerophobetes bacterium]